EEAPAPAPAPRVEVLSWAGSITGAGASASTPAGALCCAQVAPAGENADVAFAVVEGLKGIVVELVWTHEQFDLDLIVAAADYDPMTPAPPQPYTGHRWVAAGGAPGQPEGRATVLVTEAEALAILGDWTLHVNAKGPAHEVPFTLFVSLFYDQAPAADYTAAA
ncbi:MAG TPA: hypothetical protein VFH78_10585, partial [Candidatus Thermoplasmatota archaeon]|nr:hypothetical protein [Candidatus Thermoplasmatota archaeon]